MFGKFTEDARRAVFFARYEASQRGNSHIEPEHLLLGVLRARGAIADAFKMNKAEINEKLESVGAQSRTGVNIPLAAITKSALVRAVEIGETHTEIDTPHLFLALVQKSGEPGYETLADIFKTYGVTAETTQKWFDKLPSKSLQQTLTDTYPPATCESFKAAFTQSAEGGVLSAETLKFLERLAQNPSFRGALENGKTAAAFKAAVSGFARPAKPEPAAPAPSSV